MSAWLHTHLPRLKAGDPDCVSVKVPGRRVEYASWVSLSNAEFRVFQPGRQRCIRDGVRNVHAWVVGDLVRAVHHGEWVGEFGFPVRADQFHAPAGYRRAVYDPWKGPEFVDTETLQPVRHADHVIMSGKNVYYR